MDERSRTGGTDRLLLWEAGLALVLFALAVYLFVIPAARDDLSPAWWTWVLLAILFFGLLGLDDYRRRRVDGRTLRGELDDLRSGSGDRDGAREGSGPEAAARADPDRAPPGV